MTDDAVHAAVLTAWRSHMETEWPDNWFQVRAALKRAIELLEWRVKEDDRLKDGPWTQAENNAFNHPL